MHLNSQTWHFLIYLVINCKYVTSPHLNLFLQILEKNLTEPISKFWQPPKHITMKDMICKILMPTYRITLNCSQCQSIKKIVHMWCIKWNFSAFFEWLPSVNDSFKKEEHMDILFMSMSPTCASCSFKWNIDFFLSILNHFKMSKLRLEIK